MDVLIYDNFSAQDKRHIYSTSPICAAEIVEPFYIIIPDAMRPETTAAGVSICPKGIDAPVLLGNALDTAFDGMPVLTWKDRKGQRLQYSPGTYAIPGGQANGA